MDLTAPAGEAFGFALVVIGFALLFARDERRSMAGLVLILTGMALNALCWLAMQIPGWSRA